MRTIILTSFVLFAPLLTFAAPHPRDSIIVESKTVSPRASPCQSAGLKVRVWVTNKDSIANISLHLQTQTNTGGAYAILSRLASCSPSRGFAAVADPLLPPGQLKSRLVNASVYHSNPPDTFAVFFNLSDPTDDFEKYPPHLTRTPLVDLKFDTVLANIGEFEIDSGKVLAGTTVMVNLGGGKVDVNFVKGVISVAQFPKGDLNLDYSLNAPDVVLMLNCVFLGIDPPAGLAACDVNCTGVATPLDVIYQINAIFGFWSYPCP